MIRVPLEDHLLRDERILASARAASGGVFYATNQRILLYKEGMLSEEAYSLYYSHIVSVAYRSKPRLWLLVVGVIFLIGVFIMWQVSSIPWGGILNVFPLHYLIALRIIFLVWGVASILLGILLKRHFYELIPVASMKDMVWRTEDAGEDTKKFARFVEDQIAFREESPVPETVIVRTPSPRTYRARVHSSPEKKAMVKCEYCGALISQGAIYCPKCGVKRK